VLTDEQAHDEAGRDHACGDDARVYVRCRGSRCGQHQGETPATIEARLAHFGILLDTRQASPTWTTSYNTFDPHKAASGPASQDQHAIYLAPVVLKPNELPDLKNDAEYAAAYEGQIMVSHIRGDAAQLARLWQATGGGYRAAYERDNWLILAVDGQYQPDALFLKTLAKAMKGWASRVSLPSPPRRPSTAETHETVASTRALVAQFGIIVDDRFLDPGWTLGPAVVKPHKLPPADAPAAAREAAYQGTLFMMDIPSPREAQTVLADWADSHKLSAAYHRGDWYVLAMNGPWKPDAAFLTALAKAMKGWAIPVSIG
jgi:hypothetical protein